MLLQHFRKEKRKKKKKKRHSPTPGANFLASPAFGSKIYVNFIWGVLVPAVVLATYEGSRFKLDISEDKEKNYDVYRN